MKKKSSKSKSRKPAMHGKRYAIAVCPYCQASIYQRHVSLHIQQFHLDEIDKQAVLKKVGRKHPQEQDNPDSNSITVDPSQLDKQIKAIDMADSDPTSIRTTDKQSHVVMILDSNLMLLALTQGGMPCTSNELKTRFFGFLEEQLKDTDTDTALIHIDW